MSVTELSVMWSVYNTNLCSFAFEYHLSTKLLLQHYPITLFSFNKIVKVRLTIELAMIIS